ncbi:Diphthamide biosynthesis protein 4 [Neophaeococcomyces mojaviensis]|uniref:Diphthamide biosynthesis protein 4 n=1 Tax=Neophaeococcomyces mojaviensis TaxID=3383035 RepID=A0ACC2ZZB2_9EURO|nr:Diphthamide biosynthesis protein 4 [Knufia sp. JES_112]
MSTSSTACYEQVDHYTVLGLQPPRRAGDGQITNEALKAAHRRALLLHHPDKVSGQRVPDVTSRVAQTETRFTVDQIVKAYETLANPISKAKYNETLLKRGRTKASSNGTKASSGLDTFDLEDLEYSDSLDSWMKTCRCGGTYQVNGSQLEDAGPDGEIIVGCNGCSLCINVVFDILEE